eukprot:6222877-Amphidinium_carterae.1
MEQVMRTPNELSMVVGDFNLPFEDDLVGQAMQARGALLDIGQVLAIDGATQAPTYRTSSAATVLDRVMCTPALIRYVAGLTVCTSAGTGAHQPVVVSFHSEALAPPPQLVEVLQIPPPQGVIDPET